VLRVFCIFFALLFPIASFSGVCDRLTMLKAKALSQLLGQLNTGDVVSTMYVV
jgi:hypothetical protein